jgi:hypothetical protein
VVGVEVVVVLVMLLMVVKVMDFCVTVNLMQYKFFSSCLTKKLLLVVTALAGGLVK